MRLRVIPEHCPRRLLVWLGKRPGRTPDRLSEPEVANPWIDRPRDAGRATVLPNVARMYTLGLDTIAGAKLLQLKFGASGVFQPDQAVMHGDRRARFIRVSDGAAVIRYWGGSQPVAVPAETLSLPPEKPRYPALRAPAGADARQIGAAPNRLRLTVRAEMGRLPRYHPRRRQLRP